jgi:hypothetical protein
MISKLGRENDVHGTSKATLLSINTMISSENSLNSTQNMTGINKRVPFSNIEYIELAIY